MLTRRGFLIGIGAALAAPAIVRASSLMPVRTPLWMPPPPAFHYFGRGILLIGDTFEVPHNIGKVAWRRIEGFSGALSWRGE